MVRKGYLSPRGSAKLFNKKREVKRRARYRFVDVEGESKVCLKLMTEESN